MPELTASSPFVAASLAPRDVLRSTWALFQHSCLSCLPLALVGATASSVPRAEAGASAAPGGYLHDSQWWVLQVAVLALVLICYGAVTLRQASLADGAPLPVIDALRRSARALPALLAATIIGMLAIGAGLALAVLPGLAAIVWLSFAWIGVLWEGRGPMAALGDSVRLVRGRFWPLAGLFGVALAVVFVYVLLMVVLIDVVMAVAGWRGPADTMGQGVSKVLVGIVVSLPVVYLSAMLVVAWRTVRDIQRRVAAAVKSD